MIEKQELRPDEIKKLSSPYISDGKKNDVWEITGVEVDNDRLSAKVRMKSYGVSATDADGFHLSVFSALEFVSQLNVIYIHLWAGYSEKTLECWMTNADIANKRAIRNPEQIQVEMTVKTIRRIKGKVYVQAHARIFDEHGLFEITTKAIAN